VIELVGLTPAAEQGWQVLFELAQANPSDWLLVGGQMIFLLAAEHTAELPRPTDDVDVVVNVRARPRGTEWLSNWLLERQFEAEGVSAEGIAHRFVREAVPGPGRVVFDVLAPEGLGEKARLFTLPPFRTVQAPGTTQAFERSELVDVAVVGLLSSDRWEGQVRRPSLLGALVAKAAAATEIAVRENPERDWQDAALLLSLIPDPLTMAEECGRKDRQRLARLAALRDRSHVGWSVLTDDDFRRGVAALDFLTAPA
jgi:hypothetical protein